MRVVQPTPLLKELREELITVLRKYMENITGEEILAIMGQMVGQTIALQDQRTMTPERALKIVEVNIESGNKMTIDSLLNETKGSA